MIKPVPLVVYCIVLGFSSATAGVATSADDWAGQTAAEARSQLDAFHKAIDSGAQPKDVASSEGMDGVDCNRAHCFFDSNGKVDHASWRCFDSVTLKGHYVATRVEVFLTGYASVQQKQKEYDRWIKQTFSLGTYASGWDMAMNDAICVRDDEARVQSQPCVNSRSASQEFAIPVRVWADGALSQRTLLIPYFMSLRTYSEAITHFRWDCEFIGVEPTPEQRRACQDPHSDPVRGVRFDKLEEARQSLGVYKSLVDSLAPLTKKWPSMATCEGWPWSYNPPAIPDDHLEPDQFSIGFSKKLTAAEADMEQKISEVKAIEGL